VVTEVDRPLVWQPRVTMSTVGSSLPCTDPPRRRRDHPHLRTLVALPAANGFRPARVGCVVDWFPAAVTYRSSTHPTLTAHVGRAQASGLPGATLANPLYRSTNTANNDLNRSRACGDAPSIAGRNCDEYPLATTYRGLASGGTDAPSRAATSTPHRPPARPAPAPA
jgi:hypothetical protein